MQQNNQKKSDEGPSKSLKKQIGRWLEYFKPSVSEEEGEGAALPRFFLAFLLLFGAGMLVISLYGEQGLIAYSELKKETARLQREVEELEEKRLEMTLKIKALQYDPSYIELLAKQKLGLALPDETLIQLPEKQR